MKTRGRYIIAIISIIFSLLMVCLSLLFFRMLRGDVVETSKSIDEYGDWALSKEYTQLMIFPEEIPDTATNVEYYYKYESGFTRPMCQIYLYCQLDQQDYYSEVNRLSNLSFTSQTGETKTVHFDETAFMFPAYVTMEGYDFCYEYALLDMDNSAIIYIYSMNTIKDDVYYDKLYLPSYFMEGFTDIEVSGLDRFTMYEIFRDE